MLKIVIVEDEDVIRDGLVNFIDWNSIGYEFAGEACDGKEALDVIDRVKPDVLLTDIRMPFMDGLSLLETVKEKYPDLYFIILSGHDEFDYARRALTIGVYEYILKPVNIGHLKEILLKLKAAYEKRQSEREEFQKLKDMEQERKFQNRLNILHHILIDHIPVSELHEKLSLLKEEMEKNYFAAGVFEMQNLALRTMDSDYLELIEIDREFGERVVRFIRDKNIFLFKSGTCERILCMEARDPQTIENKIIQLNNQMKDKQDEQFRIILSDGKVHKGLEGLIQSHMEARAAQEKANRQIFTNVLYPESRKSESFKLMDFDATALTTEIKTGTKSGIDSILDSIEKGLKSKGMSSHMMAFMVISDIYYQVIKLPEEVNGYTNDMLENPIHYYEKIISQKDVSAMFCQLKKICYTINEFFTDVNSGKFTIVLKRAIDYINANYTNENLMIKDVAQYAYVSSSYLSIILKKEMGITFIEYLTKVRMEHAKQLLKETQLKHYEIAEACGYSNSTYFSTIFKRFYGVSPSGFLTKIKEDTAQ